MKRLHATVRRSLPVLGRVAFVSASAVVDTTGAWSAMHAMSRPFAIGGTMNRWNPGEGSV